MKLKRIAALAGASALEWIAGDPRLLHDFLEQVDEEIARAVEENGPELISTLKQLAEEEKVE